MASFYGCAPKSEPVLRFGMIQWIGYSPLYLAEAKGKLPSSLRILDYTANYDVIEALKSGELDAACLTLDGTLLLAQNGLKFRIILVLGTSDGADALLASESILSVKDLKDKRVAYEPGSVQEYILSRALKKQNMSMSDVVPVLLKYDAHADGWQDGLYDAVATFEPEKQKLIGAGMHSIFDSTQIPNEIIDLLVVTDEAIQTNPLSIQKTVDAYFLALSEIKKDESTYPVLGEYLNTTPKRVREALFGVKIINAKENLQLLDSEDPQILSSAVHVSNYLKSNNRLKESMDIKMLLYPDFIQKSQK
ncbi:ABC transporter substrate-binding protein [bacterium]|nr:ABC transporter substrate-binding protein [bacterium]MBU1989927.1 ABC transporter substrate-binding protein [bacterium]